MKTHVLLFVLSLLLLTTSINPVWAQGTTRFYQFEDFAVKHGWSIPSPNPETASNRYCKVRQPSDSEKTDFLNFCNLEDGGDVYINSCKKWAESYLNGLPNCPTPTPNKIKILPTNSPTQSPTFSPTTTPTLTLTPTPTPKKEPFSLIASLNSNSLLREIIISLLTSVFTILVYNFATKRKNKN